VFVDEPESGMLPRQILGINGAAFPGGKLSGHVGLSAAQPNLADENIREGDGV